MTFRLLIDECLSPELVALAIEGGYVHSTCVRDRDLLGAKDWELVAYAVESDFTLVTSNLQDFRGAGGPEPGGHYAEQPIHAGLICLSSHIPLDLQRQEMLFRVALQELQQLPDLVNQALEVFENPDGSVSVTIYDIAEQG